MLESIYTKIKLININLISNQHKNMLEIIACDYDDMNVNERDCAQ